MNLIEALKHQTQLDDEGVMCGVSRQAVDEAIERNAELEALLTKADPLVGELQAENERLTDQHLDDVLRSAELEAENERLRLALKRMNERLRKDAAREGE